MASETNALSGDGANTLSRAAASKRGRESSTKKERNVLVEEVVGIKLEVL